MTTLVERWHELLAAYDTNECPDEQVFFIEQLTFSSLEEIVALINEDYERTHLMMPAWIRNLAFRLACLLSPSDPTIRRHAAAALMLYGPDYERAARMMEAEAEVLEKRLADQGDDSATNG